MPSRRKSSRAVPSFFYFTIMKYLYLKLLLLVLFEVITVKTSAVTCRIDGILYSLSGNEAIVSKTDDAYLPLNANVVIPSSITYNNKSYTVTGIDGSAFYFSSRLTSISIPKTINSIGKKAFNGCI